MLIIPFAAVYVVCRFMFSKQLFYFRGSQYDQFADPLKKTNSTTVDNASTPESIPEIERPPLRKIDQYIRPELPYLSKRATVAVLSCSGFIIMFGMRTSMGIVRAEMVRKFSQQHGRGSLKKLNINTHKFHTIKLLS